MSVSPTRRRNAVSRQAFGREAASGRASRLLGVFALVWALCMAGGVAAYGAQTDPPSLTADGPSYEVTAFVLSYGTEHADLPPIDDLMQLEIRVGRTVDGYVAPREDVEAVTMKLDEVGQAPMHRFYASAIRRISEEIVAYFNRKGLIGIFVTPSAEEIDPETGKDLRSAGQTSLRLIVYVAVVKQVRTLAFGDRIPEAERVDNPAHARIAALSPVNVEEDLLRKDMLDDYIYRLNRHPGRRVDVAINSAQGGVGDAALDFLVSENKPWFVYAQVSNTGTKATNEWRERFGFVDNQLTGHDDILRVDYTTAAFKDSHNGLLSYEAPFLWTSERLRWKLFGLWSMFDASEVGYSFEQFHGSEVDVGADLIWNFLQYKDLFVDLVAGLRWRNIEVKNETFKALGIVLKGDTDFFGPAIGFKLERITDTSSTFGSLMFEVNFANMAGTDYTEMQKLGRIDPSKNWTRLTYDLSHSFYLEPFINGAAWRDVSTPASSTLAHELSVRIQGQLAFNSRLVPQMEMVIGGLYTVRGYDESVVAGDSVIVGNLEYKLHIPRLFPIQPDPAKTPLFGKPFRWAPQTVYGRPDWDLIFRAFVDYGYARNIRAYSWEDNQSLCGAGIGFEFQFKQNVTLRADYGIALKSVDSDTKDIRSGDGFLHVVTTFLY